MEASRWLVLSPLVLALVAGATLAAGPPGGAAATAAWDPPACAGGPAVPAAGVAWFRLDPVLDRAGTLAARRLSMGVDGGVTRSLDLAPESFASGPVAGLVVAGDDDGVVSRVRLLDPARGCAIPAASEPAVIRSAVLSPDRASLVEHRVDRASRADLGVWRRPIGGGQATRLLGGLLPDPLLGPTFSTDVVLAADGRLTVASCAPAGCRVRVLDPATGSVTLVRDAGPALGLAADALVVREACEGWPCPIVAVDLATGDRRVIARDAWAAALGGPADGRLAMETSTGDVVLIDVASGRRSGWRSAGGVPVPRSSVAGAGIEAADGSIVVAEGGRPRAGALHVLEPVSGPSRRHAEASR